MARHGPSIVTRGFTSSAAARPSPHAAPPSAPPATNRPTPQFEHHHDVQEPRVDSSAFRPGWRVSTRLDALLDRGLIDRDGYEVACDWRRWAAAAAPFRVQAWDVRADVTVTSASADAAMVHRLAAVTRLREAAAALGPIRTKILESLLLNDASWAQLGRLLRVSDKCGATKAAEAVTALADWRAGRAVASPPAVRYRNQPGSL